MLVRSVLLPFDFTWFYVFYPKPGTFTARERKARLTAEINFLHIFQFFLADLDAQTWFFA